MSLQPQAGAHDVHEPGSDVTRRLQYLRARRAAILLGLLALALYAGFIAYSMLHGR